MRQRLPRPQPLLFWFPLCLCVSVVSPSFSAENWTHWRGPLQTGFSPDKNLPDEWDPRTPGKNNLVWKQPYGCRSTPMVMNGRVYIIGADNEPIGVPTLKEKQLIGERVTCFDAKDGKKIWEQDFNVFHTDIVANRLGWSPLSGDAENKRVYAHSTAGFLFCFDAETGKVVWLRQLTEEFGRVTGYGGRVGSGPLFDSGLVIVGLVNGSWGNQAVGLNRFFAFDAKDGRVVWVADTPNPVKATYYSNPVVAVINGERIIISGGADGALHAFQVRTGKRLWSYALAVNAINPSPVVDGNLVYISHGEENPDGGLGRVVCVDASQVANGKPKLVWEFKRGIRFGLSSPAIHGGYLYVPDDGAKLYCFDAKKGGAPKWKYNYGISARGAPVIADGKIYISETVGKFHIIKMKEDGSEPDDTDANTVNFRNKPGASGFVESNGTPSIADGRIYVGTRDELYCIGKPDAKPEAVELPKPPAEKPAADDDAVAQLQVIPADVLLAPGAAQEFELRAFTAKGQPLPKAKLTAKWSLPVPPPPKGSKTSPPALDATLDEATGKITVNPKKPAQQGYVDAAIGEVKARARVRIAPRVPYKQDFENVPVGAVPGGWVNTQGKFRVVEHTEADGTKSKVLFKVNDNPRPPIARALAYFTPPDASNYTIEADLQGNPARGKLADMGVCAGRYMLIMDGKTNEKGQREIRLTTWDALPTPPPPGRVAAEMVYPWKEGVWYRAKLTVEPGEKQAVIRGKVWERGQPEPAKWLMEVTDPRPNHEGAAALYGYIPNATDTEAGAEILYDNVAITPNGGMKK
jgi:outer membrane protein assembly factor BamB